jgi:hypothetical protein
MHLHRDPDFAITSPNWDNFSTWEWCLERRAGYLSDADWDRDWAPTASSDDDDEDKDEDEDEEGIGVQAHQPPRVIGELSDQIYNDGVVCDDSD